MHKYTTLLALLLSLITLPTITTAEEAKPPVVIGNISSFTGFASLSLPYQRAVDMAVDEINSSGGILGRNVELERRDDAGKPDDSIRWVQQIAMNKDRPAVAITGFIPSHVAMAASITCNSQNIPCIAIYGSTDKLLNEAWNPWIFRIARNSTVIARVMAEKAAAEHFQRLAIAAPRYEHGVSVTDAFKKELSRLSPQIEVVAEQWAPLLKLDAAATSGALLFYNPDSLFSPHVGSDLSRLVRQGNVRGLFKDKVVIVPNANSRQDVGELLKEIPGGWISLCHSPTQITIPAYIDFRRRYLARYEREPDEASVYGYSSIYAIKAAIEKAGNTDRAAVRDALEGLTWGTPLGDVTFRKFDHQSNMPIFYGKTTGDGSGLPLCDDMKQIDPWKYWPRPDDVLSEVLKNRLTFLEE